MYTHRLAMPWYCAVYSRSDHSVSRRNNLSCHIPKLSLPFPHSLLGDWSRMAPSLRTVCYDASAAPDQDIPVYIGSTELPKNIMTAVSPQPRR